MTASNQKRFTIWTTITLLIMAVFVVFLLYPLVLVLYKSVVSPTNGGFSLEYFQKFFGQKYYWGTLVNSFQVTTCATLLSVLLGLPIAYFTRSTKILGRGALEIAIIISYLSPPFIGAYAWIQLLGRQGVITKVLNAIFHTQFNGIYGFTGILLVFTLQSFPLIYIYISGALKRLDNSLNEAAESLGCTGIKRIVKVVMPLIMPTILASALLVFMRIFADFGTPMLIGEGYRTIPVLIYNQFISEVGSDDGFAAALSVIVIIVTTVIFLVQKLISSHTAYSMSALKPMEPQRVSGVKNILIHVFVYLTVILAILPQIVVIYTSFLKNNGGQVFTGGYSLQSYKAIFAEGQSEVIRNTYLFGLGAIAIIIVLGILIAYLTIRKKNIITSILDTITMFPYIIPGSVLGISLLFAFSNPPLLLSGTAIIMIISFAIRRMPYTIRSSTAILGQISPSVEEAAISLGSSQMQAFIKVTVPMMLPGVLSGAIMSWITAISELSSSVILYGHNTQTLTVAIYTAVVRGNFGTAAAYSSVLTITSIISLILFFKLSGSREISV
ncbi:MAG: ABC transporter, permease protein [Thermocaproicibacter melissae]|jgi:iron(III) transport system permease protein|uniref:ABC transporter permease n=1 Tax=Thermocaproicibacter melissae TaxID=2966552 RepID=UPI0024B2837A|nr:iron ABC transporter permease [Thermocaproicibacter melissae]WBY63625.1 iron ABC transporter permease [Thermocaproicibacter melissae]